MLGKYVENVREVCPLIQCITNYVTVNDVANAVLACGGSPVMADAIEDAADFAAISSGVYLNIGTLNKESVESMLEAGKSANKSGGIVLLDPVGAGATRFRTETVRKIMQGVNCSVIRGNISEIKAIAAGEGNTRGVDADENDTVTEQNLVKAVNFAKSFAEKNHTVVAITGAIDLVADGKRCFVIRNGKAEMSRITGTGCMLSGIAAAFAAANKENILDSVAAAVLTMGIAGEIGVEKMEVGEGNAMLRTRIIDAIYNMDAECLEGRAKYEIV